MGTRRREEREKEEVAERWLGGAGTRARATSATATASTSKAPTLALALLVLFASLFGCLPASLSLSPGALPLAVAAAPSMVLAPALRGLRVRVALGFCHRVIRVVVGNVDADVGSSASGSGTTTDTFSSTRVSSASASAARGEPTRRALKGDGHVDVAIVAKPARALRGDGLDAVHGNVLCACSHVDNVKLGVPLELVPPVHVAHQVQQGDLQLRNSIVRCQRVLVPHLQQEEMVVRRMQLKVVVRLPRRVHRPPLHRRLHLLVSHTNNNVL